ncbi:MAG: acyl-ACP--UDP-N-acetylglucosamine O-acyltransferase [Armatimonadota bacterium]
MSIHPTAIVDPGAEIGEDVEIGPYAVVHADVTIGDGCILEAHSVIKPHTRMGKRNHIYPGVVLGGEPQDRKWSGEVSELVIGDDNAIREVVTIHRATGEGQRTVIGDNCMFMAYSHVGHNAIVGNDVMVASYVGVSGFCRIEDYVVIGGIVGIHQYVTVGKMAMIGGQSKVEQDVPPFMMSAGKAAELHGLNVVGLRRRGVPPESRAALRRAYRLLYRSGLNTTDALEKIKEEVEMTDEVRYLVEFMERVSRGSKGRQLNPS